MKIEKISIQNEAISFEIDKETDFKPFLFKRITIDNYKYFNVRIPLEKKEDNVFYFPIERLLPYVFENQPIRCDFIGFKESNESTSAIIYENDFPLSEYSFKHKSGTVLFQVYRNAVKSISLFAKFIPTWKLFLSTIAKGEDSIAFEVSKNFNKPFSISLMRRANMSHDFSYDCEVKINATNIGKNKSVFTLPYKDLLSGYCNNSREIWDFVSIVDNKIYPVYSDNSTYGSSYFDLNDDFKAKFFISDNRYASLFTAEGSNGCQKKIKIAIIGSCYTKEAFHSISHTNPNYKRIYENGLIAFHQSIISLMSKPISVDPKDLKGKYQVLIDKYSNQVFGKSFLSELKEYNPDYLIIDNYIEIAALLYEIEADKYLTESFYLADTPALKKLKTIHKYEISNEKRFVLYQNAVDKFAEQIKKYMPEKNIIIVRAHPATHKMENGVLSKWDDWEWVKYVSKLWERNDNYLIKKLPNAHVIDMRSDSFYSVEIKELAFSTNHFQSEYYRGLLCQIDKIVLQDLLKNFQND